MGIHMKLSNLATTLGGSVIREMFNEALKMKDTISFTVGEPDFVTPPAHHRRRLRGLAERADALYAQQGYSGAA